MIDHLRGCFVTGTDTGAGKTVVAAAVCAAARAAGQRVAAFKPVVTGLDEPPGAWPADHEVLAEAAGVDAAVVTTRTFGPPVSPHLAAELAGARLEVADLAAAGFAAGAGADILIAEGVGGLLVPLNERETVRDLAVALGLPVVIAARPGLGTISHCLLTIEAARAVGLDVRAIVLTPWPSEPGVVERSNRETVARMAQVDVATLGPTDPASLAAAAATLPWPGWLGP